MNVNIKSLVINVNLGGLSNLVKALLAKVEAPAKVETPADTAAGETKAIDTDGIVAFVKAGENGKRTLAEIQAEYARIPGDVIASTMRVLAMFGVITIDDVSADGAPTFSATVAAEQGATADAPATTEPVTDGAFTGTVDSVAQGEVNAALDADDAQHGTATAAAPTRTTAEDTAGFLTSHARFTMRTLDACQRNGISIADLIGAIDAGVISTKHRRSDGATLYYAVPELNVSNVVAFLNAPGRFRMRTVEAVAKHFVCGVDAAAAVLDDAVSVGAVALKRRRRDRKELYLPLVASYTAPVLVDAADTLAGASAEAELGARELNVTNLRSFLASDARFTLRTLSSIATHFGVSPSSDELFELLDNAEADGDIQSKTRRADRTKVYGIA